MHTKICAIVPIWYYYDIYIYELLYELMCKDMMEEFQATMIALAALEPIELTKINIGC